MTRDVALVYIRQSRTDLEDQNHYSPETQRQACLSRPEVAGLPYDVYEDLNQSGGSTVGRRYFALLSRRAVGDVRYVVCYDFSRRRRGPDGAPAPRGLEALHACRCAPCGGT